MAFACLQRSIATHDIDGLVCAVMAGNCYGLRRALRHIGPVGRRHSRRISVCPIPGNVIGIGVMDISCSRLRDVDPGFTTGRPVIAFVSRPENSAGVSSMMVQRSAGQRTESRMPRACAMRRSRSGEGLGRENDNRYNAERRERDSVHSIHHGTHQFVGSI
jgi:hypothetical protein